MVAGPELKLESEFETETETLSEKPVINRRLSASSPRHPGVIIDTIMVARE